MKYYPMFAYKCSELFTLNCTKISHNNTSLLAEINYHNKARMHDYTISVIDFYILESKVNLTK